MGTFHTGLCCHLCHARLPRRGQAHNNTRVGLMARLQWDDRGLRWSTVGEFRFELARVCNNFRPHLPPMQLKFTGRLVPPALPPEGKRCLTRHHGHHCRPAQEQAAQGHDGNGATKAKAPQGTTGSPGTT